MGIEYQSLLLVSLGINLGLKMNLTFGNRK